MKRSVLIMTDSPRIHTGFSHIGRKVAMYLHNSGLVSVSYLGWFDDVLNPDYAEYPFPIYTTLRDRQGHRVTGDVYAYMTFKNVVERTNPDIVLAIGDSVSGDRRTLIMRKGVVMNTTFEDLFLSMSSRVKRDIYGREIIEVDPASNLKALCVVDGEATWRPIRFITRHYYKGRLVRVQQCNGETVCTNNHSLIDSEMNEVRPTKMAGRSMFKLSNIPRNIELSRIDIATDAVMLEGVDGVHAKPNFDTVFEGERLKKLCTFLGAYVSNGHLPRYKVPVNRIRIDVFKREYGEHLVSIFRELFNVKGGSVYHDKGNLIGFTNKRYHSVTLYSMFMYNFLRIVCGEPGEERRIPTFVYNLSKEYIDAFIDGYIKVYNMDRVITKPNRRRPIFGTYKGHPTVTFMDHNAAADFISLMALAGRKYNIERIRMKSPGVWWYYVALCDNDTDTDTDTDTGADTCTVPETTARYVKFEGHVYDLTVEEANNFVDALGPILLHNSWMVYAPVAFGYEDKASRPYYSICYPPIDGNPIPVSTRHMGPNNSEIDINWAETFASYDEVIAYCKYGQSEINRAAGRPICKQYIYYGVDTKTFNKLPYDDRVRLKKEIFGLDPDDFLIITVARNQPRKLYPVMVDAVARFIRQNEKGRRVYYYAHAPLNDPPGWNLAHIATMHGLSYRMIHDRVNRHARVIFDDRLGVGKGPSDDVLNLYYNAADLGLFIYNSEGWGMPPHECMATGTPTIMTRYSAPTDWAEGRTCWVEPFTVQPEPRSNFMRAQVRPEDVQRALIKMYNDKDYRSMVAKRGYEFAQTTDWEQHILPAWLDLLLSVPVHEKPSSDIIYLSDADRVAGNCAATQPLVSVIVPTFNGGDMLVRCIGSIRSCGYSNIEIIVVDNGTWEPKSKKFIDELASSNVKVVEWNTKYSPARVLNAGADLATGEYLLFIDNDVTVTPGCIEAMIQCFIDEPQCGAAAVRLINQQTGEPVLGALYDDRLGYVLSPRGRRGTSRHAILDALTCSCMMVKRSVFTDMGGFDERYRMYYQDFDFSYRLLHRNLVPMCNLDAYAYHIGGATNRVVSKAVYINDHMSMVRKFWKRYLPRSKAKISNADPCGKEQVAVVKLLTMGDVVLTTPLLPIIREKHPDAYITVYTSEEYHDLFMDNPYIDEIKVVGPLEKQMFGSNWGMFAYDAVTFNVLFNEKVDHMYQLNQLDMQFEYRRTGTTMTQSYADMLGLGSINDQRYIVVLSDDNIARAEELDRKFAGSGPLVVMHTTAGWSTKEWPKEKFAELAMYLYEKHRARIYVVGAKGEGLDSQYVRNICGSLSLRDIVALQKRCSLYIGADSGPLHLAKAANCPIVALFGCTNPAVVGFEGIDNYIALQSPYAGKVNCGFLNCYKQAADKNYEHCMKRLSVDTVAAQCTRMLERTTNIQEYRKGDHLCSIDFSGWEWRTTLLEGNDPSDMCDYNP